MHSASGFLFKFEDLESFEYSSKFYTIESSYVCSTPNVLMSTKFKFGALMAGYGITFVKAKTEDTPGLVWISSFGPIIPMSIKPSFSIKVDNGILLDKSLHSSFDKNYWCIHPETLKVIINDKYNIRDRNLSCVKYENYKVNIKPNNKMFKNLQNRYEIFVNA